MAYIIGIDGGGTSTQGTLSDMDLRTLATAETGATNYHSVGIETARDRFESLITALVVQAGISLNEVSGICIGGAGIDSSYDVKVIEGMIRELDFSGELVAVNDAVTALAGGNQGLAGGIVISGTGSVAFGVKGDKQVRTGGWGHLIDDDGSGYQLGVLALKHIMRAFDGRGPETQLWESVKGHLGIECQDEIIQFLYGPQTTKDQIAALAPYVLALNGQDRIADRIVQEAVNGLAEMILTLYHQLGADQLSLTVGGSVLTKSLYFRNSLIQKLSESTPNIDVHLPYEGPVAGALRIIQSKVKEREAQS